MGKLSLCLFECQFLAIEFSVEDGDGVADLCLAHEAHR